MPNDPPFPRPRPQQGEHPIHQPPDHTREQKDIESDRRKKEAPFKDERAD
jgi:hypothetical protein